MSFSKGIPVDDLAAQALSGESEMTSGYVKQKIREGRYDKRAASAGSRARKEIRTSLAKVIRRAKSIAELFTEDDQEENLRVIREAKSACHVYVTKKGEVHVPDHKTRLAAVALDLAYREGKPVERQLSATGKLTDMKELLARLQTSPAYQESLQKAADCKEVTLALPPCDN